MSKALDRFLERGTITAPDREVPRADVDRLFRNYGRFSLAFKTTQANQLKTFGDRAGYVAYAQKSGRTIALGDPVAAAADAPAFVGAFIERFGNPAFVQVSATTTAFLAGFGYRATVIGVDSAIRLPHRSFAGKANEHIRYATNVLNKKGFRINDTPWSPVTRAMIETVSAEWRKGRPLKKREMAFLNRGLDDFDDPAQRVLVLHAPEGALAAFIVFDPLYENGSLVGYVIAMNRRLATAPTYADLALTRHPVDTFRAEGLQELRLGLSPLVPFANQHRPGRLIKGIFALARRSDLVNRNYLNTQGIAVFKRRFHSVEEPLFFCARAGTGVLDLIAALRLSKLL